MVIFLQKLSIGIGTHQYFKVPDIYQTLHIYGGRAFARYDILMCFLHIEQEMLAYKTDLYSQ